MVQSVTAIWLVYAHLTPIIPPQGWQYLWTARRATPSWESYVLCTYVFGSVPLTMVQVLIRCHLHRIPLNTPPRSLKMTK